MATFCERAAHLVDHMFFVQCILTRFVILVISRFEGRIWFLIAPVPGHNDIAYLILFCIVIDTEPCHSSISYDIMEMESEVWAVMQMQLTFFQKNII